MSKKTDALIEAGRAEMRRRPTGRLAGMLGTKAPEAIAVPLEDDGYAINVNHIKRDPDQPRHTFDQAALEGMAETIRG